MGQQQLHEDEELEDGSTLVVRAQNLVNVELRDPSTRGKILYLYSGPKRDKDGFSAFCKENLLMCDYVDKEFDQAHNLLDEQVWDDLYATLSDYDGYLRSPPCSTFTAARMKAMVGPDL